MRFPSPTPLPPSDVALIAAYEAERGVTVCPPCRFSETEQPHVTIPLREQIRRQSNAGKARAKAMRAAASRAPILRRREEVLRLSRTGAARTVIAAILHVSVLTVRNDLVVLRKEGRL